jgi:hypothetical protein
MFEIVAHGDLERMLPAPMEIARSAARAESDARSLLGL